jgi:hypothetical protein
MSAPAVAVSADGKKFAAAWKDLRTGRNNPRVYWSVSDKPIFTSDEPIDPASHAKQDHPSIAIDSSGTVWATWEETRAGKRRILARSSAADSIRPISDPHAGAASFPVIACNAGLVAVVYEATNRGSSPVMFRLLEPVEKEEPCATACSHESCPIERRRA